MGASETRSPSSRLSAHVMTAREKMPSIEGMSCQLRRQAIPHIKRSGSRPLVNSGAFDDVKFLRIYEQPLFLAKK